MLNEVLWGEEMDGGGGEVGTGGRTGLLHRVFAIWYIASSSGPPPRSFIL